MATFKCKMCGGALEINDNATVTTCEYCGTKQTLPKLDDDRRANMYDRANHFRRNNEFDKAMGIYEQILNEDNTDAEAYWSLVLCRYGIEYVEDPVSHKHVPTVNRTQFTSIFDDDNYKSALRYADGYQRTIYEQEAKTINEIQKGILAISQKEELFDVFICYKESDNGGRRTPDSVLAQDLYYQLTQEGFKVFFSRITLEDKLGSAYEPYIFAALNSAKVMVVLGTKTEFFNAVWVKNEWSRFLALIKKGENKALIPAYKDMDPYDLPEEFSHLQAQDMSKLGFMQDLIRGIKKIVISAEHKSTAIKEQTNASTASDKTATLLKRVFMFLESGNWSSADEYCEKVLDIDPENAEAYVGKLMAEMHFFHREQLGLLEDNDNANYKNALKFGGEKLTNELKEYSAKKDEIKKRLAERYIQPGNYKEAIKRYKLKEIVIPNGVTSIGDYAFDYCSALTSITIPDSVTSIGGSAFYNCSALTSVTIGNGVTSIGDSAFSGCSKLTSVTIPDSVTSIGSSAFYNCSALTSITIPDSVTSIESGAFEDCRSLTSVTIPGSVASIGLHAFSGCDKLVEVINKSSLNITKGSENNGRVAEYALKVKTEGTSDIVNVDGYLFYTHDGTNYLLGYIGNGTDLVLPDKYNGQNYEIYQYAFRNCSSLTSVTIGSGVTSIDYGAFDGCVKLIVKDKGVHYVDKWVIGADNSITSAIIKEGTRGIANRAFYDCSKLTTVTIPDSVTSIDSGAFYNCSSLTSVNYTGTIDQWVQIDFSNGSSNPLYYAKNLYINNELVTEANITTATKISAYAFEGCSSLKSVTIPYGVTSIGSYAFSGCSKLTSITIPNSVTSIGSYAFSGCSKLTSITIPNSVTSIGGSAFYNCSALTSVTIGNGVTSIGGSAFYNCSALTSITIPDSVTSIGGSAFYNCSALTSVTIGNGVTSIGGSAFYNCSALTSVTIGNGVTSIGGSAFYNCSALTSITIPDDVTSIGSYAFSNCSSLTNVKVTAGNTTYHSVNNCIIETVKKTVILGCRNSIIPNDGSVTSIGGSAFYNCSALTSITIPDDVTSIGSYAFCGCKQLSRVKICNKKITIEKDAFDGCPVNEANKKSGGCYVATCVYGSYDCPEVWTLRRYRDDTLGSTWYGRAFVKLYYAISPTLVKWFGKTKWFKKMWKGKLDRMIKKLQNDGVENTPYNDKEW